jgi:hypothetical protein
LWFGGPLPSTWTEPTPSTPSTPPR